MTDPLASKSKITPDYRSPGAGNRGNHDADDLLLSGIPSKEDAMSDIAGVSPITLDIEEIRQSDEP